MLTPPFRGEYFVTYTLRQIDIDKDRRLGFREAGKAVPRCFYMELAQARCLLKDSSTRSPAPVGRSPGTRQATVVRTIIPRPLRLIPTMQPMSSRCSMHSTSTKWCYAVTPWRTYRNRVRRVGT